MARTLLVVALLATAAQSAPLRPPLCVGPQAMSAPYAGHANHAYTAPAFQWGWFGAEHFEPRSSWHRDYNGNLMRWSTQRRY